MRPAQEELGSTKIAALFDKAAQEDEDEAAAEREPEPEEVVEGGEKDTGDSIDGDGDVSMIDHAHSESQEPRKTQREKRNERAASVRKAIDTHRTSTSGPSSRLGAPVIQQVASPTKRSSSKNNTAGGLNANWRDKVAGLLTSSTTATPTKSKTKAATKSVVNQKNTTQSSPSKPGSKRAASSTANGSAPPSTSRTSAKQQQKKGGGRANAVQERGLTDRDVELSRDEVVGLPKVQQSVMIDSEDVPSVKPKSRTRRSPSSIPLEKSKSAENLPDFLREIWDETVLPTLKEKYGATTKLWDIEHGALVLRDEIQELINTLCPDDEYDVVASSKDLVYEVTRSRLFHWRRLFIITAKKLVDPVLRSLPNNGARKRYVREALQYGGAAYFDTPDGQPGHSRFVLETLAAHLNGIKGSVASSCGRPYSALALTFAAVQRAFASWEDGVDTGVPDWSGKSMKQLIESTWRTNIAGLIAHPDAFDRILAAATEVMQTGRGKKRGTHHKMSRDPKNEAAVSLFGPNPATQRDESEPLQSDDGDLAASGDHQAETDRYSAYSGIGESGDDTKDRDDWGADEQADCDDEAEHCGKVPAEDDEYGDYTDEVEYEDGDDGDDYGDGNGEAFEDAM
ncbi:hypothetical protein EVJ58_g8135 [Rhodofomes roseus]|uniref:Uncharacterized protein n=1 Tax=Rhodofomes roseus TaxID=34475 RepID=A0A4Y9XZE4_9APHY|nr:hypothetical protein EVJ58_g8135 [Rhodofomes roseus]